MTVWLLTAASGSFGDNLVAAAALGFVERHVSGEIHGENFSKVAALLGNTSMWQDMQSFGLDNTYSSLHPVLRGDNPDSSFSEVCYEKGFQLLVHLESLIGRP